MTAARFAPGDVPTVLAGIAESGVILIGGQAVNVWCNVYVGVARELLGLGPFTSKDVDVQAQDARAARELAKRLRAEFCEPSEPDGTNIGYLIVDADGARFEINVLVSPFGVDANQAEETAIAVTDAGVTFRVMHPVLCMESKLANIVGLARTDDDAMRHLRQGVPPRARQRRSAGGTGRDRARLSLRHARPERAGGAPRERPRSA